MLSKEEFDKYLALIHDGKADNAIMEAMVPYKVDNAIIMAAGFSARCLPLSNAMPKGLFLVKGEVLIEREIKQLKEAGIENIVVVTGFQSEKFDYLKDKYGVHIILNKDFDKYNNMSSLYAAQKLLGNSYVLCSDNYYEENVFSKYVYEPYYSCVYSNDFCDEYCVVDTDPDGTITKLHRGGSKAWYTIGDCYFDRKYSAKFVQLMNDEWADLKVRNMLMDDFQVIHISELPMKKIERADGSVLEFDTLEEIVDFDPDFKRFMTEHIDNSNKVNNIFTKYADVKSYHSVPTEQNSGRLHLNENQFKPTPRVMDVLKNVTIEDIYLYDLTHDDALVEKLSEMLSIPENNIFVHNGSAEVIKSIFSILLNENDAVLVPSPGWSYYKSVADAKFAKSVFYEVREGKESYEYNIDDLLSKARQYSPKMIVLTSPQMPTGCLLSNDDIERVIKNNPNSVIMLDEAYWGYADFSNDFERKIIRKYSNVVITRTFSKFYGLANIRLGYGLCSYPLRRTIGLDLPLFRACGISRMIAIAALEDVDYYDNMRKESNAVRDWFIDELNTIEGVKAFKSGSNYVFIRLDSADPEKVRAFMSENHILIRLFTDKDALRLRITVAPKDIMERVVFQLKKALLASEK